MLANGIWVTAPKPCPMVRVLITHSDTWAAVLTITRISFTGVVRTGMTFGAMEKKFGMMGSFLAILWLMNVKTLSPITKISHSFFIGQSIFLIIHCKEPKNGASIMLVWNT